MLMLGIETSCDETAIAIVNSNKEILSHQLISQLEHQKYGGVIPEIAARKHLDSIGELTQKAITQAKIKLSDLNAVAVTCGPGLIGGLVVGVTFAKSIASVEKKPFIAINHLAAHALMPRLNNDIDFPYLLLLTSGGHCQLILVLSPVKFQIIGTTQDDAAGECLDKCAKMLGFSYPGGAKIEKMALLGDNKSYNFPIPLKANKSPDMLCNFSFSGLKSSVRRTIENLGDQITETDKVNICASLQYTVSQSLQDRLKNAILQCNQQQLSINTVVISGGVAANKVFRKNLQQVAENFSLPFFAPPIELCTDNGVMVAWAGIEKFSLGLQDDLSFAANPRWSLERV